MTALSAAHRAARLRESRKKYMVAAQLATSLGKRKAAKLFRAKARECEK